MQQKELSLLCVEKMLLEFGNDFCLPCEPIAWIWHKGNDPIRRRTIAVDVVDVDLPEITISLVHRIIYMITILLTVLVVLNVLLLATKW
jgi:hypothetical protein